VLLLRTRGGCFIDQAPASPLACPTIPAPTRNPTKGMAASGYTNLAWLQDHRDFAVGVALIAVVAKDTPRPLIGIATVTQVVGRSEVSP
jgi:hypothetical protein